MALTEMIPSQWLRRGDNSGVTGLTTRARLDPMMRSDDPFVRMHETMDRLFDDLFSNSVGWSIGRQRGDQAGAHSLLTPQVDISEADEAYRLSVDLPGVESKDIELSADEESLTIRAEKQREASDSDDDGTRFHRVERSFGRFERMLTLPVDADTENISAKYTNGVLEISVPRRKDIDQTRGRRIEIESD